MFNSCYRIWHKQPPSHTIAQTHHQRVIQGKFRLSSSAAHWTLQTNFIYFTAREWPVSTQTRSFERAVPNSELLRRKKVGGCGAISASSVSGSQSGRLLLSPARMYAEAAYISYHDQSPFRFSWLPFTSQGTGRPSWAPPRRACQNQGSRRSWRCRPVFYIQRVRERALWAFFKFSLKPLQHSFICTYPIVGKKGAGAFFCPIFNQSKFLNHLWFLMSADAFFKQP